MTSFNKFPIKTEDMDISENILLGIDVRILKGKNTSAKPKPVCKDDI